MHQRQYVWQIPLFFVIYMFSKYIDVTPKGPSCAADLSGTWSANARRMGHRPRQADGLSRRGNADGFPVRAVRLFAISLLAGLAMERRKLMGIPGAQRTSIVAEGRKNCLVGARQF